ncbi:MAG: UDP-N-acetylglucosamine 2-epimerase [Minisyncoccales bacterium]
MKKIIVVSGSRSEYGLLKPVIKALKESLDFEVKIFVTGSHLEKAFGDTKKEIEKDFKIDGIVPLPMANDTNEAMGVVAGKSILGFAEAFGREKPSMILILGDRVEIFGAAIAAYYLNVPIAHLHGGDRSIGGHLDDSIRHAITKLAHIHLAATKESASRIIKMGEEKRRVFVVGAPGLDSILDGETIFAPEIAIKYNLDLSNPIILAVQHALTTEAEAAAGQMKEIFGAIVELKLQTVLIYPNADAGSRRMIEEIEKIERKKYPFIQTYKNINHSEYLGLMNAASVMIGNSSGGIIEAPSFKLPVVNIGSRQKGRERATNVIDADCNKDKIKAAVKKALSEKFVKKMKKCKNPYGDGKAAVKIAKILGKVKIDKALLQKKITY